VQLVPCPIKKVFGVRCPGCGMTRATLAILTGDFRKAYSLNPLVFIVVPLVVWGILDAIGRVAETKHTKASMSDLV